MASSSSSLSSRNWRYNVFTSFCGRDVRRNFVAHLRKQFDDNGITMFDDQGIERSKKIAPSLTEAIRESRILIVILSKNYASSSWCLDELVEILMWRKAMGQIVMTIFYGVEPSDVRKQTGEFGIAFNETVTRKALMDKERQKWSKALDDVGNIAGEASLRWDNEAKMIEKISKDVLHKLNATPSKDFDGMVGLEAHLREMESLLDLGNDGVKMVAITGPAGIGKSTIARALGSKISRRFQLTCFVDNLEESYDNGRDEYGYKLRLQQKLLTKILNQGGMRNFDLGAIKKRFGDQRVLIILDDVNHIKQLEALANDATWFGHGSRIVITTKNKEILQQHEINNIYHVGFPSDEQALKILCRYAFKQRCPRHGFEKLAERITKLCGKLPLGLSVVGSSLRGKKEDEWGNVMSKLETIVDDIWHVLRVGYESLRENEQSLFLHIAQFFNYKDGDLVKAMFADSDLDVKCGLKILVNRSLIEMDGGRIVMHRLLQQVGRKAIQTQDPGKRQILMDADEICDVLENKTNAESPVPRVYNCPDDKNYTMHIPDEMEFPPRLRLLDWKAYPSKSFPPRFHPEYLVEVLDMPYAQLEKLCEGIQPLTSLKKMDMTYSLRLKELPDLSNATNLEILHVSL